MGQMMKQWAVDGLGLASLSMRSVPIRRPLADEVLVRCEAVSLNYRDKLVLENGMGLSISYPFVPISDLAGVVEDVGPNATRFKTGDRVISSFHPERIDGFGAHQGNGRKPPHHTLGGHYPGVASQYVTFPENWFVRAPVSLDAAEASTLPCAGLTAWFALAERGHVKAGDTIVLQGTGGVATFGMQIAKLHGARTIVTSKSAQKRDLAKSLGADVVLPREGWSEAVLRETQDLGADHILELAGGANLGQSLSAVAVGGRISLIGVLERTDLTAPVGPFLLKSVTLQGIGVGNRTALEHLVKAVDTTGLKPVIGRRHDFDALPAALADLDQGIFGKIVVIV